MSTFVERYKKDWEELAGLVRRARSWTSPLTSVERERLDELYRRTTVHLARVATRAADPALAEYLNRLTASAHSVIYLPSSESLFSRLGAFVTAGFGRAIARSWRQQLLSLLLVVGGALLGFYAASSDQVLAHALWPTADSRQPGSTTEQLLAHLRHGRDDSSGEKFFFASFLFQHNLKVGLLAMATGVLASVPTVFLMIFNGMLLGVFAAIHYQVGIRAEMWAWILPHGITEIGAIVLCGGIGLMLGQAVVRPGMLSRTESLLAAGREAARIGAGVAGMLVLAALIESYVRQSHWSTAERLTFAAGTAILWTLYIAHGFHRERQARQSALKADSVAAAR